MKILFITRAYGESAGGMERLSYEFIAAAKYHPDIKASVLANETDGSISLVAARIRSVLFAVSIIPRALTAARNADVIHIGDPVLSLTGWLIHILFHKPIVVSIHGLDLTYANLLYQLYLRFFFRDFDFYLPISLYAQTLLRKHHVRGKVAVLTPGINDRYFDPRISRERLSALLALAPETTKTTKILLTAGRLVPRKGHAWFIRNVLPRLPENVLYVIAGIGPADADIQRAIEKARQAGRVRLLGRVSDRDLKVLYNTADVFVQPNIKAKGDVEGFGIVLLEAALCNRHVVASNIEGIPSAIHDSKNGALVPQADVGAWISTIKRVLQQPPMISARDYTLQTFAWDSIIDRYYELIEQVHK